MCVVILRTATISKNTFTRSVYRILAQESLFYVGNRLNETRGCDCDRLGERVGEEEPARRWVSSALGEDG